MRDHSKQLVPLRGRILFDNDWYWKTRLAEPYPAPWGVRYGEVAKAALAMRKAAMFRGEPTPFASKALDGSPLFTQHEALEMRRCNGFGVPDEWKIPVGQDPFVNFGNGASSNLSSWEHLMWAVRQPHPLEVPFGSDQPADLLEALHWQSTVDETQYDEFYEEFCTEMVETFLELEPGRREVIDKMNSANAHVAARLNGRFLENTDC